MPQWEGPIPTALVRNLSNPTTKIFYICLGVTIAIWTLRGLGILSFLPSSLIWLLLLLTIGLGVVSGLQRAR